MHHDIDNTFPRRVQQHLAASDSTAPPTLKSRRLESNEVWGGTAKYGYHEVQPTDLQDRFLAHSAQPSKSFPAISSSKLYPGKPHFTYRGKRARDVQESGQDLRTDTGSTLLAIKGGGVAGHTASGMDTTGQAEGHDVVRAAWESKASEPSTHPREDAVFGGALTLLSLPPGAVVNRHKPKGKLRSQHAETNWESRRTKVKESVNHEYQSLPVTSQARILKHLQSPLDHVNNGATSSDKRAFATGVPTSPRRSHIGTPGEFGGGDYISPHKPVVPVSLGTTASVPSLGRRLTKPLRERRY